MIKMWGFTCIQGVRQMLLIFTWWWHDISTENAKFSWKCFPIHETWIKISCISSERISKNLVPFLFHGQCLCKTEHNALATYMCHQQVFMCIHMHDWWLTDVCKISCCKCCDSTQSKDLRGKRVCAFTFEIVSALKEELIFSYM